MEAVILVGGEGTRLRPLTYHIHKTMAPVLNEPFLEHMIYYLKEYGVDDIILALCYLPQSIKDYFGDGSRFGVKLTYVLEDSPLGTAGAVKNAERYLQGTFLVFNGDVFTGIDLGAMLSFHRERGAKATIALTPVEDPSAYGVVETDAQGRAWRFVEKPPREEATTNLINAGIYILDEEVLQEIPPDTFYMFEHHVFPGLLEKEMPVYGYPSDEYWIDMGTPEKYLELHRDLLRENNPSVFCSQIKQKKAQVAIHPSAVIEGDVVIGEGCTIGPEVHIKGPSVIGEGCIIFDQANIEGSILWSNVRIGQRAVLKDCIIGDNSVIGDDTIIPQGVVIGGNILINEGSRLEPDAKIGPETEI
ncbi:sugar phosphate nucleotidyltransferase [Chloroflexota bacterium]